MITYGIPVLTVLVAVGIVWLVMLRARRDAPYIFERPVWELVADADGLRVRSPNGDFRELTWDDVGAVQIRTASVGAGDGAVDWVFDSASGGPPVTVPNDAAGVDALLRRAQEHLRGFVYEDAIALIGTRDVAELDAWRRSDRRRGAELEPGDGGGDSTSEGGGGRASSSEPGESGVGGP